MLHEGQAKGFALRLDEPLSFWGGFDPVSGTIIDRSHPQVGLTLTGRVLVMDGSRGSSGTPGVLGEALRVGTGPAAILTTAADVNLVAGALVAATLYGSSCPVRLIDAALFEQIDTGMSLTLVP